MAAFGWSLACARTKECVSHHHAESTAASVARCGARRMQPNEHKAHTTASEAYEESSGLRQKHGKQWFSTGDGSVLGGDQQATAGYLPF